MQTLIAFTTHVMRNINELECVQSVAEANTDKAIINKKVFDFLDWMRHLYPQVTEIKLGILIQYISDGNDWGDIKTGTQYEPAYEALSRFEFLHYLDRSKIINSMLAVLNEWEIAADGLYALTLRQFLCQPLDLIKAQLKLNSDLLDPPTVEVINACFPGLLDEIAVPAVTPATESRKSKCVIQ